MAIKKQYVSDLSGESIEGKPVTLTIGRTVMKSYGYGGGAGKYRANEYKKLHLTAAEAAALFNSAIRQWLGFEKAPVAEKKPAGKKAK